MSTATMKQPIRRSLHRCNRTAAAGVDATPLGERLASGDDSVLAELYTTHAGRILAIALHVLHDRQLAEEVVQETILRAWRCREQFDSTRNLEPWLFRIARNVAYDMSRARSCRPQSHGGDPTPTLDSLAATDIGSDPEVASDALALRWAVRAAIDELPDAERSIVRLQHLDGLSHTEISARLGISVGTVKSRSHRAHRRLSIALGTAHATLRQSA